MSESKYKILKPFYCFHPEIIFDGKVRPAFWGVEWTIVVKNNPQPQIRVHCMRQVDTETDADALVKELESIGGEFAPWQAWNTSDWYLLAQYRKATTDPRKRAIWRGHHSL